MPVANNKRIEKLAEHLLDQVVLYEVCAVAFSGGVDSAVVAKAAFLVLGDRAIAVTSVSASLPEAELFSAKELAKEIGIRHLLMNTDEIEDASYARNAKDRCYHCKSHLYQAMVETLTKQNDIRVLLNGTNADDLGDYRPGLVAAEEFSVRSPLADCGFTKADVRELAQFWNLPVWNKPAAPCLASRIAYGEEVTPKKLKMVEAAEQFLRSLGLNELRVRYHAGDLARLEVPPESIAKLAEPNVRAQIITRLKEVGFLYVTLDLSGFQSGSMNAVLTVEELLAGSTFPKSDR